MTPPDRFIESFFTSLTEEVLSGQADAGDVIDRYYTPDVVQVSDGITLNRDRLVAHLRPLRRNLLSGRYEVHEAVRDGHRIAARFTIHARLRGDKPISTEVCMFAEFAPDGRMHRAHQLTRDVTPQQPPRPD